MKTSRILIFEERPSPGRKLRLNLLDHAVEFDFRDPAKEDLETLDLSRYAAIVAPVESARTGMIGVLSDANRYRGPLFLYRDEPPVHEVARWVIWGSPSHGGPDGPVADRLLAESLEYYSMASMYQQCLEMMSTQDEEKLLAQVSETFVNALGGASCVIWLVSPSDPDEMLIASVRGAIVIDREGSRFFLSRSDTAEEVWRGDPVSRREVGGEGRPQRVEPLRSDPSSGKPDRPCEAGGAERQEAFRRAGDPHGPDHRRLRRRRPEHGRSPRPDREGFHAGSGDRRLLHGVPRRLFREGAIQGVPFPTARSPSYSSSSRTTPSLWSRRGRVSSWKR